MKKVEHINRATGKMTEYDIPETAEEIAKSLIENAFMMGSPKWLNMHYNQEPKELHQEHWETHGRKIVKDRIVQEQKDIVADLELHSTCCYIYDPSLEFQKEILSELEKL